MTLASLGGGKILLGGDCVSWDEEVVVDWLRWREVREEDGGDRDEGYVE